MATNYQGVSTVTPGSGLEQPQAGQSVNLSIPQDTDPNNVASMFSSQYRNIADYLAFLAQSSEPGIFGAPSDPLSNSSLFTSVQKTGPGTGTIAHLKPSGAVNEIGFTNAFYVIEILTSGAVGVATYRHSSDGGRTFSSSVITAASVTAPTRLSMSGTFTAGDFYYYRGTGKGRMYGVHPLGVGSLSPFIKRWSPDATITNVTNQAAFNAIPEQRDLGAAAPTVGGSVVSGVSPNSFFSGPALYLDSSGLTNRTRIGSSQRYRFGTAKPAICDFHVITDPAGPTTATGTIWIGVNDAASRDFTSATAGAWFEIAGYSNVATANMSCITRMSSVSTTTVAAIQGYSILDNVTQLNEFGHTFRIEFLPSCVRFSVYILSSVRSSYIPNSGLVTVVEHVTNLPTTANEYSLTVATDMPEANARLLWRGMSLVHFDFGA